MGNSFSGRTIVEQTGRSIQVTADGRPEFKHAGVTIDWTTIVAVAGADVTLKDGVIVRIGEKYLRYGQVLSIITASGKYGPYDPAAVDGRAVAPVRGEAYILNETIKEDDIGSDHPPVIEGGLVFLSRIIQSGVVAASLALGPTLANLLAGFPRLRLVKE
jgi:hypothetical protein